MVSEEYHDIEQPFSSGRIYDPLQPMSEHNRPDVLFMYDEQSGPINLDNGKLVRASNTRGFLASVSDLSGEEHYSYDARGRVAWLVKRIAPARSRAPVAIYRTVMAYDSSDRLISIQYPNGTRVIYSYDLRGRINRIGSLEMGVIVADQTYTAAGLRADTLLGNGVLTTRVYDPRLRLSAIATRLSQNDSPTFQNYRYRYDGASNVLAIEDERPVLARAQHFDNSQQFTYDSLYRLTGASYDAGHLSLAYDRTGNLTERRFTAVNGVPTRIFTPGHIHYGGSAGVSGRIGRMKNSAGSQALSGDETGRIYTYDANGNLKKSGDTTYTWDFKDRLVSVKNTIIHAEYVYDYAGRRIIKRIINGSDQQRAPPVKTHYVSKYFEVVDGEVLRYVFDRNTRLSVASQGSIIQFYHHDIVGSTDALSDASANLVQSNAFMPFGEPRIQSSSGPLSAESAAPGYLFAQKERDKETGLSYFEARYLNSNIGRFISVDPAIITVPYEALESPQLLNGYAFAANSPFRYKDSSGKWVETLWDVYSLSTGLSAARKDPSVLNVASVIVDLTAVVLPGVPGGAGASVKVLKGASKGSASAAKSAYEIAKKGGRNKHAGYYRNMKKVEPSSIKKSTRNLRKRIDEHKAKVAEAISTKVNTQTVPHWEKEIRVFKDQININDGLLRELVSRP